MKINIVVKPHSKRKSVERKTDGSLEVRVSAPAVEGRANEAVIEALARFFAVRKSAIVIRHGAGGRKKIVEIEE